MKDVESGLQGTTQCEVSGDRQKGAFEKAQSESPTPYPASRMSSVEN